MVHMAWEDVGVEVGAFSVSDVAFGGRIARNSARMLGKSRNIYENLLEMGSEMALR